MRRSKPVLALVAAALTTAAIAVAQLSAQSEPSGSGIPHDAVIVERARIPATVRDGRELVLWMMSPVTHDRDPRAGAYACPERTLGSYFSGPTRVSLLNTNTGRVLNTIKLVAPDAGQTDEFYVPYRILSGLYYPVPGVPEETEGKPSLLALRDLNGDGIAVETAFFEAEACMGLPTALIGYSPTQDEVVQYRAELEVTAFEPALDEGKIGRGKQLAKTKKETLDWIDYLFAEKPIEPGHWKYDIDYLGRGGSLDSYDVRYDPAHERFVGTLTQLCPPDNWQYRKP